MLSGAGKETQDLPEDLSSQPGFCAASEQLPLLETSVCPGMGTPGWVQKQIHVLPSSCPSLVEHLPH